MLSSPSSSEAGLVARVTAASVTKITQLTPLAGGVAGFLSSLINHCPTVWFTHLNDSAKESKIGPKILELAPQHIGKHESIRFD